MEESRTQAVGRKRKKSSGAPASAMSSPQSRESGEISRDETKQENHKSIRPNHHTLDQIPDEGLREVVRNIMAERPGSTVHHVLALLKKNKKKLKSGAHPEEEQKLAARARQAFKHLRKLRRAAATVSKAQRTDAPATDTASREADADSSSDEDVSVGEPPGGSPEVHMTEWTEDLETRSEAASVGNAPLVPSIPSPSDGLNAPPSIETVDARIAPPPNHIRLRDVDADEQTLQRRYWRHTSPDAIVICLACGQPGHHRAVCAARTCSHCGVRDVHLATACPRITKCARCRAPGHTSRECFRLTVPAGGFGDTCDICRTAGHVEEQCPSLGMLYRPQPSTTRRIPRHHMIVACYRCSSNQHWGDDCPLHKHHTAGRVVGGVRVWSREYADMFIIDDAESQTPVAANGTRHHLMAQLGDWR